MALIINGERIEDAAIRGEESRLQRMGSQPGALPPGDSATVRARAKDNIIARVLLQQEITKRKVKLKDGKVDSAVEAMMQQEGGKEAFMQRRHMTDADLPRLHQQVEENLRIDLLLNKNCPRIEAPTDAEARDYYKQHLNDFVQPPQVRVSHVVRQPGQGPAADKVYDDMVKLRGELQAGADFAEVADRASECRQEPGGDLGFFARGQMVEAFEAVVFSMQVGEISPVFLTQFGFHIATVTEKREQRQLPFEEVSETILGRMRQGRRHEAAEAYVGTLKAAADIVDEDAAT